MNDTDEKMKQALKRFLESYGDIDYKKDGSSFLEWEQCLASDDTYVVSLGVGHVGIVMESLQIKRLCAETLSYTHWQKPQPLAKLPVMSSTFTQDGGSSVYSSTFLKSIFSVISRLGKGEEITITTRDKFPLLVHLEDHGFGFFIAPRVE